MTQNAAATQPPAQADLPGLIARSGLPLQRHWPVLGETTAWTGAPDAGA